MKKLFVISVLMFVLTMFSLAQSAPGYKVVKTWKLGGEGGWDYLTVDPDGRRLFIARSTRVMVVDEDSGKLLTEIPDTPGVSGISASNLPESSSTTMTRSDRAINSRRPSLSTVM